MSRGYLTPDAIPTGTTCRVLFIPDSPEFIANVTGALQELLFAYNWTKYGTLEPDEAANALIDMFDNFSFNVRGCRMVGEIILWSGTDEPSDNNLLLCDGAHVSNEDFPSLYNVIGTVFGGTGATDFALPDLRGKVAIGSDTNFAVGDTGGEIEHTLTEAEMPSHAHTYVPPTLNVDLESPGAPDVFAAGIGVPTNTGNTGGGSAHNNMQPYLTLRYYIQAA